MSARLGQPPSALLANVRVWCLVLFVYPVSSVAIEGVFTDVAVGNNHACVLKKNGRVWCWGAAVLNGQEIETKTPRVVKGLRDVASIFAGGASTCSIDTAGRAACWGLNHEETLKKGEPVASSKPFALDGLPPVQQITIGYLHICALSVSGQVYCWGNNGSGELGDGTKRASGVPQKVPGIKRAIAIDAGVANSCAVEAKGIVKCWGTDHPMRPGGFAINSRVPKAVPVINQVMGIANGRNYVCGLLRGGRVLCWGSPLALPLVDDAMYSLEGTHAAVAVVEAEEGAIQVTVEWFSGCAVYKDGRLKCWEGMNKRPQFDSRYKDIKKVSLSLGFNGEQGCALLMNGSVTCWGAPRDGGLVSDNNDGPAGLP